MHDLSFSLKNVFFEDGEHKISVEIFTFNNVYTADPSLTEFCENGFYAKGLLTSGGQESARGYIKLSKLEDSYHISGAIIGKKVRCIKLAIDGLPFGLLMER